MSSFVGREECGKGRWHRGWLTFRRLISSRFHLLLLVAILLPAGCAGTDPVIKVGLVAPFEGRHRAVGYDAIYAARLAIREANAQGGVAGYRVELVTLDDGGDPELARKAASTLAIDPGVVAVAGHWLDDTTNAALPIYDDNDLPLLYLGEEPFVRQEPHQLPPEFLESYQEVTPFTEEAGPYAASTYEALNFLFRALKDAEAEGEITRASVAAALDRLQCKGC